MKGSVTEFTTKSWYQGALWLYALFPLAVLYACIVYIRRIFFRFGIFSAYRSTLPIIVVGNITVGGTGKSPLVAHLVNALSAMGFKPGIVSRGYGSSIKKHEVREVLLNSLVQEVGDEPVMLRRQVSCPIFISPSRKLAVKALEALACDFVITDDGLQHYALARDLEICVVDGERQWGNGYLLPMGPLRETVNRLRSVDMVVVNGPQKLQSGFFEGAFNMELKGMIVRSLRDDSEREITDFNLDTVHAVAAIGNPERFFKMLEAQGIQTIRHAFSDHHIYSMSDFNFGSSLPIIMTEKDAVKCRHLQLHNAWYFPVTPQLSRDIASEVVDTLKQKGWLNG